jgi:hypothetical protein
MVLPDDGYAAAVRADNPLYFWRLNDAGGVVAADALLSTFALSTSSYSAGRSSGVSGFGYTGPSQGSGGSWLQVNDGLYRLPGSPTLTINAPYSIECWLWLTVPNTSVTTAYLEIGIVGGPSFGIVQIGGTGAVGVRVNETDYPAPSPASSAVWSHYVATINGTAARLYYNGALLWSGVTNPAGNISLGGVNVGQLFGQGLAQAGWYSEVAIYPSELSAARVLAHYNAASSRVKPPRWNPQGAAAIAPSDTTPLLRQILNMVTLIQRHEVPFSPILGTARAGLIGTGSFAVQGLVGVQVVLTAVPPGAGSSSGTPPMLYDVGWVNWGDANAWTGRQRIDATNKLIMPEGFSEATRVGYTLPPGVVATITEVQREP